MQFLGEAISLVVAVSWTVTALCALCLLWVGML